MLFSSAQCPLATVWLLLLLLCCLVDVVFGTSDGDGVNPLHASLLLDQAGEALLEFFLPAGDVALGAGEVLPADESTDVVEAMLLLLLTELLLLLVTGMSLSCQGPRATSYNVRWWR